MTEALPLLPKHYRLILEGSNGLETLYGLIESIITEHYLVCAECGFQRGGWGMAARFMTSGRAKYIRGGKLL